MSQGVEGKGPRAADAPGRLQKVWGSVDEDGVYIEPIGRTKQEFKDETNINNIIAQIGRTKSTEWIEKNTAWMQQLGDRDVPDINYKELMDIVTGSEERFLQLPSDIRAGFQNDVATFLDFVQSENGEVELAELVAKAKPVASKLGSVMAASEEPATTRNPPSSDGDES